MQLIVKIQNSASRSEEDPYLKPRLELGSKKSEDSAFGVCLMRTLNNYATIFIATISIRCVTPLCIL